MEVIADHAVHVGEDTHQLAGNEGEGTVHDPSYASSGGAFGFEDEVGDVVTLEGFKEVELNGGLGWLN